MEEEGKVKSQVFTSENLNYFLGQFTENYKYSLKSSDENFSPV